MRVRSCEMGTASAITPNSEPGEHADIAVRRRRPLFVVHRERQLATARQCANAALDCLPHSIALQDLEPETETDLVVRGRAVKRDRTSSAAFGEKELDLDLQLTAGRRARDEVPPVLHVVIDERTERHLINALFARPGAQTLAVDCQVRTPNPDREKPEGHRPLE